MTERNISFKVDAALYKQIKLRVLDKEKTIKDYLIDLIKKDLETKEKN